ncbi:helix-turn-helix transcriptional regulator [Thiothrix nivea]|uniref:Phage transcriptional regulator, AlpA n=1 Tax=Thiothrix nivea (strain ATCC 35100 / DSM 5205 / JP2) TaxID=870187 RepID=A0A656HJI6_THINJ|nr:AlpA family phage regulatory protein [Thiothrix nivea]EIJ36224.1 phage transcriptional regulator, AlpA [Thiothrix nivea DSM 5205]
MNTASISRLKDVIAQTGLSKSTIYRLEAAGKFPARVKIGLRAVGWKSADIQAFINGLQGAQQ